jgi:ribosome-binding factor A
MPPRTTRLAEQIRSVVGDILVRDVRDPGIGFVTVTRVRVTDDLLQARVYYTTLGEGDEKRRTDRALHRALPFIRRSLGQRLRLRRVPELSFRFDESIAGQARVEELLQEIGRESAARSEHDVRESDDPDDHEG